MRLRQAGRCTVQRCNGLGCIPGLLVFVGFAFEVLSCALDILAEAAHGAATCATNRAECDGECEEDDTDVFCVHDMMCGWDD